MHVYEMNDCDFVVSKLDEEKTKKWYSVEIGEEIEEVKELDLDKNGIFYGVSAKKAKNKRLYPPNEAKIFGRFAVLPCGEVCEYISLREAIKRDGNQRKPYIIASTEY